MYYFHRWHPGRRRRWLYFCSNMHQLTYLLLGSNLGDRVQTLRRAADLIGAQVGTVRQQSSLYETAPWGITDQPAFLNQVLAVETDLAPEAVLHQTQAIEQALGRIRPGEMGGTSH